MQKNGNAMQRNVIISKYMRLIHRNSTYLFFHMPPVVYINSIPYGSLWILFPTATASHFLQIWRVEYGLMVASYFYIWYSVFFQVRVVAY